MSPGRPLHVVLPHHPSATKAELLKYEESWMLWFVMPQDSEPKVIWWENLGTDLADDHSPVETIVGYIEQRLQAVGHRARALKQTTTPTPQRRGTSHSRADKHHVEPVAQDPTIPLASCVGRDDQQSLYKRFVARPREATGAS